MKNSYFRVFDKNNKTCSTAITCLLLNREKTEFIKNAKNDKTENFACPVHGRYWKVKVTVHAPMAPA
jgi:hypothetical protein